MRRFGQISAALAIVATLLLGFGCGGMAYANLPTSGHHHHHPPSPDASHHHAILIHAPCCAPVVVPAREPVPLGDRFQPVAWTRPAEAVATGLRVTPEPRPPKAHP